MTAGTVRARRAVLGCGLLAAGLHLPLFIGLSGAAPKADTPLATGTMHVRTLPAPVAAPVSEPARVSVDMPAKLPTAPAPAPATDDLAAAALPPAATTPPIFTPGPPELPLPDAQLPESGVLLRVYLVADDAGRVTQVVARSLTADASDAFARVAEHALGDARLQPSGGTLAYCLTLRYDGNGATPPPDWLPHAASRPERCLGGSASGTTPPG